ncbi:MAG: hypothetical protein R2734_07505 [Nocardioides sp.]
MLLVALAVASALLFSARRSPTSVARSYVITRLGEAPNFAGGQSWLYTPTQGQMPRQALDQAVAAVAATSPAVLPTVPQLESVRFSASGGAAYLVAKRDVCAHLVLASGPVPGGRRRGGDGRGRPVLLPGRAGDEVDLGRRNGAHRRVLPAVGGGGLLLVRHRPALQRPAGLLPDGSTVPPQPGPVIVDSVAVHHARSWRVRVDLLDIPSSFTPADLQQALATRSGLDDRARYDVPGASAGVLAQRPGVDRWWTSAQERTAWGVDRARRAVADPRRARPADAAGRAAADLRLPELALAAPAAGCVGLAEPVLLLLLGLPVGLGLGVLSARLLARWRLVPACPCRCPGPACSRRRASWWPAFVSVGGGRRPAPVRPASAQRRKVADPQHERPGRGADGGGRGGPRGPAGGQAGRGSDVTDLLLPVLLAVAAAARHPGRRLRCPWWTWSACGADGCPAGLPRDARSPAAATPSGGPPWPPPRSRWVSSPWVPTTPASPGAPASPTPSRQPTRVWLSWTRRPGPAT